MNCINCKNFYIDQFRGIPYCRELTERTGQPVYCHRTSNLTNADVNYVASTLPTWEIDDKSLECPGRVGLI